jgi:hypothetical protein
MPTPPAADPAAPRPEAEADAKAAQAANLLGEVYRATPEPQGHAGTRVSGIGYRVSGIGYRGAGSGERQGGDGARVSLPVTRYPLPGSVQ